MAKFGGSSKLSDIIDVGGIKYYMGSQKSVELLYKNYNDFLKTFKRSIDENSNTEYLLRKYMGFNPTNKYKLKFDSKEDKTDLIKILKNRAAQLKDSSEFTSSLLKNTIINSSYLNILELIQQLEGPEYKGSNFSIQIPDILPCTKAKKHIKQLSDDKLFQILLEISWFLLHPEKVPKDIECDWAKIIKQLDTLRLEDIVKDINSEQVSYNGTPFNFFKNNPKKTNTSALEPAKQMAKKIQGDIASDEIKNKLKKVLNILQMRKYLNTQIPHVSNTSNVVPNVVPNVVQPVSNASNVVPTSPNVLQMKGGATLDKPLEIAVMPMFDYFKGVFDPIYSIIDNVVKTYTDKIDIQQLLILLHICNNINPDENINTSSNTYGIYKISNVDTELILFITGMIKATHMHVDKFENDAKYIFNQQLFQLPKVRLTSLLNRSVNSISYKDPNTIPYIQFFTIGGNMSIPAKEKFMNVSEPKKTDEVYTALTDFFKSDSIYIICTKSENIHENIPMNMYEIDYSTIDVSETGVNVNKLVDNYFNQHRKSELYLEQLVTLIPYVVFNDAELALSILSAFKEHLPN